MSKDDFGSYSIGDRVTMRDSFHFRADDTGTIEDFSPLGIVVYWDKDGESQRHPAHRTYDAHELKTIGGRRANKPIRDT